MRAFAMLWILTYDLVVDLAFLKGGFWFLFYNLNILKWDSSYKLYRAELHNIFLRYCAKIILSFRYLFTKCFFMLFKFTSGCIWTYVPKASEIFFYWVSRRAAIFAVEWKILYKFYFIIHGIEEIHLCKRRM